MNKIYFSTTVNLDGTITIPAFAVRGMGYGPCTDVNVTLPTNQCLCECEDSELFISRCCGEAACMGYTSSGEDLNIPAQLLSDANISIGGDVSILVADGALVLVAAEDECDDDLPVELCALLNELGVSPLSVRVMTEGGRYALH